jgi:hypothetical protein
VRDHGAQEVQDDPDRRRDAERPVDDAAKQPQSARDLGCPRPV